VVVVVVVVVGGWVGGRVEGRGGGERAGGGDVVAAKAARINSQSQPLHPLAPQHPLWCQRGNAAAPHGGATYKSNAVLGVGGLVRRGEDAIGC